MSKCDLYLFLFLLSKWKCEFSSRDKEHYADQIFFRVQGAHFWWRENRHRSVLERCLWNATWVSVGDSCIHESTSRGLLPQTLKGDTFHKSQQSLSEVYMNVSAIHGTFHVQTTLLFNAWMIIWCLFLFFCGRNGIISNQMVNCHK